VNQKRLFDIASWLQGIEMEVSFRKFVHEPLEIQARANGVEDMVCQEKIAWSKGTGKAVAPGPFEKSNRPGGIPLGIG
jgi:hypothetical protein